MLTAYLPVLLYFLTALGLALVLVLLSSLLGPKQPTAQQSIPYECGVAEVVPFEGRFPVKFYLTAMLFLLFDIEVVFLFPWAVMFRQLGWAGLIEMGVFLFILLFGFFYAWRRGAFEWR